jgi:hypothetical protein
MYLTGLKKVYDMYNAKEDLNPLMAGKVAIENSHIVPKWIDEGLAKPNRYVNHAFNKVKNENTKLDFILQNLK